RPTAIYTLALHDALPISLVARDERIHRAERIGGKAEPCEAAGEVAIHLRELRYAPPDQLEKPGTVFDRQPGSERRGLVPQPLQGDRKSTRLNSSHVKNSY